MTFRKILLNKCQKEFEKEKSEENLNHAKMDALAQKGLKVCQIDLFDIMLAFNLYYLIPIGFVFPRNKTKLRTTAHGQYFVTFFFLFAFRK